MHLKLTDLAIRSLPVPERGQKDYYDISMPGLCLRVSQGGSKVFTFLLRKENKRRRITIGKYGTVTLSEARTAANKILYRATIWMRTAAIKVSTAEQFQATVAERFPATVVGAEA